MASSRFPLGEKPLPAALRLSKLIGPSFILLGLGLGSGEVILWPYLASNYGLGMVWAIVLGVTMQFFINMEVERYALVYGESIFVGFARIGRFLPLWFLLSTFFGFGWPGIGLAGATLLADAFGIGNVRLVAILVFIVIGLILSMGRVLYKTVENLEKIVIAVGVPFIFLLALFLADRSDYVALAKGVVGIGEGFTFLPVGISIATFLGALAYAGAGGNLNLAQSCYVRDKGYGMGLYAKKITSLIGSHTHDEAISLVGNTFPPTEEHVRRFHTWWRVINLEHFIVFFCLGLFTMLTLSLLAYVTTFGVGGTEQGIGFLVVEAVDIGARTLPFFATLFLLATGIMLLSTQLTVLDSTSRIMMENVLLLGHGKKFHVARTYYGILWLQILFGIIIFTIGFDQPRDLIILGAVINAFTMFSYTGLLLYVSNRVLHPQLRPRLFRNLILLGTFLFFGVFCTLTIASQF
ncbi:MAG: Nramp family divalent metal transporter [Candidatus Peregrinibacteria bacterium]